MFRRTSRLVAALALVAAAACTTNPVTGKSQLDLIGEGQEVAIGRAMFPQAIQGSLGPLDDRSAQALVERIGQSVAVVSHRPDLPYAFVAVNDPQVNAFALPGGKIAITRGMLSRLRSVDGLAAVLGHEVGHVAARHVVSGYNRQLLAQALMLGGQIYLESEDVRYRDLIGLGALLGTQAALAHYSREQERQSDELGMDYSVKAGYSPQGLIETQEVLVSLGRAEPGMVERLFASHPFSRNRLRTAQADLKALPPDVRSRPIDTRAYMNAMAEVMRERPAWDLAQEGRELLADNRVREAESRLAQAVRRSPDDGVLFTLHAVALAGLERRQAAIDQAVEGARLEPDVFLASYVAGQLLLRPAPADALRFFDHSEQVLAGVPEVALFRGLALERTGQRQAAVGAYRVALDRDPNGQVGAAAAQRLRALGYVPGSVSR